MAISGRRSHDWRRAAPFELNQPGLVR